YQEDGQERLDFPIAQDMRNARHGLARKRDEARRAGCGEDSPGPIGILAIAPPLGYEQIHRAPEVGALKWPDDDIVACAVPGHEERFSVESGAEKCWCFPNFDALASICSST